MNKLSMHVLAWVLLIMAGRAGANEILPWVPTDEEFSMLPRYCWVKMKESDKSPEKLQFYNTLGKDYVHVHHFCAGMNFASRSLRLPNEKDRIYYRKKAFTNFQYMIDHADQSFSLMPDVYMSRGRLYMNGPDAAMALADFQKAAELRPDLAAAYMAQADWLVKFKTKAEALAAVTEGLRQAPDSKGLQKRYVDLGGQLPYPEPAKKPEPEQTAKSQPQSQPDTQPVPQQIDTQAAQSARPAESSAPPQPQGAGDAASPGKGTESVGPASAPSGGKIGNATNPWCRFCPDIPKSDARP